MTEDGWILPPEVNRLSGTEPVAGTSATVTDFWSWSMSNLRSNTARSLLAEFLVARAVGADHGVRIEWDSCDVITDDGLRIEVKASAYLQAWSQRAASKIVFSGLRGRTWDPRTGYSGIPTYNADVYVFAVATDRNHDSYDALDTDRWQFWVVPRWALQARATDSIGLSAVRKLSVDGAVEYRQLASTIRSAAQTG